MTTRIESILQQCDFPKDVALLKRESAVLALLPNCVVETLYAKFSEDMYAAGWMDGPVVDGFIHWCFEEMRE